MRERSNTLHLSVVMPAYNEEPNFKNGVLTPSLRFLKSQSFKWEIIFVDDGSTDETAKLLQAFCRKEKHSRLLRIPHGGRAAAMRAGMLEAKGKYILYTDFDQSTELSEVTAFLKKIHEFDLVIGNRGGEQTVRQDTMMNLLRAKLFVWLASTVLVPNVADINCGFKLYKNKVAKKIFSSLLVSVPKENLRHAYMGAIDSEILFLARKFNYSFIDLPVNWIRRPFVSHLNIWKEPIMIVKDLFLMRWHDFLGHYDGKK